MELFITIKFSHLSLTALLSVKSYTYLLCVAGIIIGSLVLIIHDCSDPLLELAKLVKYVKKQQLAEIIFGCFTVTWVFTR